MAYADSLNGPWKIHRGGVLQLSETCCRDHIASPDVHIVEEERSIRLYFHGVVDGGQHSFLASSSDGLSFHACPDVIGPWYLRAFKYEKAWFAIAKRIDAPGGGVLLHSSDGIQPFEQGPNILPNQRHVAVLRQGKNLLIFFTRGGDCPERVLLSTMSLTGSWKEWQPTEPIEVIRPKKEEEGGNLPLRASCFEAADEPLCELRDPEIYEEGDRLYLFYTGAGETNICCAELHNFIKESSLPGC